MSTHGGRTQGEKTLFARAQSMGLQSTELLERNQPVRKRLVRQIAAEKFIGNCLDLGDQEGKRFADQNTEAIEPCLPGKRRIIRGVFGDSKSAY